MGNEDTGFLGIFTVYSSAPQVNFKENTFSDDIYGDPKDQKIDCINFKE